MLKQRKSMSLLEMIYRMDSRPWRGRLGNGILIRSPSSFSILLTTCPWILFTRHVSKQSLFSVFFAFPNRIEMGFY
jgi:hypothetical protein